MVESKIKVLALVCRFAVQTGSRLHLPVEVSARLDWGFRGEDGLLSLGCRHSFHSPRAALSSAATVVATAGGVGTCESFRSQSSQQDPHKCYFLQRSAPFRVGRTVPSRMEQVLSLS